MEQIEKDFIDSYLSILAKEGKEICEEIFHMIGEKDELEFKKALACCDFFCTYKLDGVNAEKLVDRCYKFEEKAGNFHQYKSAFNKVNIDRRKKERWLDMRNMRLKEK